MFSRSLQKNVYDQTCRPIAQSILEGFNGTIFAYGQTGTGKTWSMEGNITDPVNRGVIPNAFHHIFSSIGLIAEKKFLVRASFLEIYNEEIRDLLVVDPRRASGNCEIRESPDSVYVQGLTQVVVKNIDDTLRVM